MVKGKKKTQIGLRFSIWLHTRISLSHTYMHVSLNLYSIFKGELILIHGYSHLKASGIRFIVKKKKRLLIIELKR